MVKQKYQEVLDLGQTLNIQDGDVKVEDGKLKMWGTAKTQYEKGLFLHTECVENKIDMK